MSFLEIHTTAATIIRAATATVPSRGPVKLAGPLRRGPGLCGRCGCCTFISNETRRVDGDGEHDDTLATAGFSHRESRRLISAFTSDIAMSCGCLAGQVSSATLAACISASKFCGFCCVTYAAIELLRPLRIACRLVISHRPR